jgi:hypothetical protein
LADLKEHIVQEHIEEQLRYSEFGMTVKLNALREGYRKNNGAGRLAGLEALSYKNHSPDRSGPAANRFYELNNGGWVYRSNSPREG